MTSLSSLNPFNWSFGNYKQAVNERRSQQQDPNSIDARIEKLSLYVRLAAGQDTPEEIARTLQSFAVKRIDMDAFSWVEDNEYAADRLLRRTGLKELHDTLGCLDRIQKAEEFQEQLRQEGTNGFFRAYNVISSKVSSCASFIKTSVVRTSEKVTSAVLPVFKSVSSYIGHVGSGLKNAGSYLIRNPDLLEAIIRLTSAVMNAQTVKNLHQKQTPKDEALARDIASLKEEIQNLRQELRDFKGTSVEEETKKEELKRKEQTLENKESLSRQDYLPIILRSAALVTGLAIAAFTVQAQQNSTQLQNSRYDSMNHETQSKAEDGVQPENLQGCGYVSKEYVDMEIANLGASLKIDLTALKTTLKDRITSIKDYAFLKEKFVNDQYDRDAWVNMGLLATSGSLIAASVFPYYGLAAAAVTGVTTFVAHRRFSQIREAEELHLKENHVQLKSMTEENKIAVLNGMQTINSAYISSQSNRTPQSQAQPQPSASQKVPLAPQPALSSAGQTLEDLLRSLPKVPTHTPILKQQNRSPVLG